MKNRPLLIIALSIPCMWALVFVLSHFGFFDWMNSANISDGLQTAIIVLLANIPVLVFIGYGIYNAMTAPTTIPKVKERMPWDKGNPLDVDAEWRKQIKNEDNDDTKEKK